MPEAVPRHQGRVLPLLLVLAAALGSSSSGSLTVLALLVRVSSLVQTPESDSDAGSEAELSECELRLRAALQRYDHVMIESRLLQVRVEHGVHVSAYSILFAGVAL